MSTELVVYKQIDSVKTIISQLIDNIYNDESYQSYLQDLEENDSMASTKKAIAIKKTFEDIKVFGANTEPLFLATEIGIILGVSNITTTTKNYTSTEKVIGYIMDKGRKIKKTFLTKHGVYRIIFNNKTKLSEVFRGFIYKLIDHMISNELDTLRNIINEYSRENPTLINESILELESNISKYRELYNVEKQERLMLESEISLNEMYIEQLKTDKNSLLGKLDGRFQDAFLDENIQALNILKKKYLKEFTISLVHPTMLDKLFSDDGSTLYEISNELYTLDNYKNLYNFWIDQYNSSAYINHTEIYYIILNYGSKNDDSVAKKSQTTKSIKSEIDDNVNINSTVVATDYVTDRAKFTQLFEILKSECDHYAISKSKKSASNFIFKVCIEHIKTITQNLLLEADNN